MFKILDEEKPEYLTVTFDVHAPTFRHEMFSEYKGTRKPMAEELRQQVPVIKEVLEAMNISTIEKAGLEADDLLGTLSRMCEESGMDVSIISGDRDTLQLATEHVKIRIPKTKQGKTEIENYYAADVVERYKVTPREFIDVKALMGDSADNIPGVPGIGEKTATKIIMEYQTIENAYAHASELKPPRASKNIQEFWEQAKMSKVLATIETHADFEFDIEKAHYENPYTEEAYKIFERLRFKNMLGLPAQYNMWTTFESYEPILKGKGYAGGAKNRCFLPVNTKGTNEYAHKIALAYTVNIFMNPTYKRFFTVRGLCVDEDTYATNEMVQWIWRSAIRNGEPITLYIPSDRMRGLLVKWLEDTKC